MLDRPAFACVKTIMTVAGVCETLGMKLMNECELGKEKVVRLIRIAIEAINYFFSFCPCLYTCGFPCA